MTASAAKVSNDFLQPPEAETQADTITVRSKAKKKKKSNRKKKARADDEVPFPDDPFAAADPFDIAMA